MGVNVFNPNLFDKIIKVAEVLEEEYINLHHDVEHKAAVFFISDVMIVHMSMYRDLDYKPKIHNFQLTLPTR